MSLQQWGGVFLRGFNPDALARPDARKQWRIGNERQTLRGWVADKRNIQALSEQAIKGRILRAEKRGRPLTIAEFQAAQERYSHKRAAQ